MNGIKCGVLKGIKIVMLLILSTFCMLSFTGCEKESVKKTEAYLSENGIESATFDYDSVSDKTQIVWDNNIKNKTIYDIESVSIIFNVGGEMQTYTYSTYIRHGKTKTTRCRFFVDGEVRSMQFVSWSAEYNGFWETYSVWILVTAGVAVLLAVIYVIVMIINDIDLEDCLDFWWIGLIPLLFGCGYGAIYSSWVCSLIIIGGLFSFLIIVLAAHLIRGD